MNNEAERLVAGTGWMPAMFGTGEVSDNESLEAAEQKVDQSAEHIDVEEAETLAA